MSDSTVRKSTRVLVTSSIMGALTILMGVTHIGFIPWFFGFSLTIMQIPVIIAAILEGPIAGLIVGLIFGIFSMIQAIIGPTSAFDPFFANPLLSVAPRLFIGPISWLVYKAFRGKREILASFGTGLAGALANTILVLTTFKILLPMRGIDLAIGSRVRSLFGMPPVADALANADISAYSTWKYLGWVLVGNGIPEAILSGIIAMLVVLAWKKISPVGGSRLSASSGSK